MSYRESSEWNDENEIRCLIIFKKLEFEGFPRGRQMELCREMSARTNLDSGNISAKVSNYKSVAGINNKSNASANTIEFFNKHSKASFADLEKLIK